MNTNLLVITYVVSKRDETGFELLWLKLSVACLIKMQKRPAEVLHLFITDAFGVTRQNLSTTRSILINQFHYTVTLFHRQTHAHAPVYYRVFNKP